MMSRSPGRQMWERERSGEHERLQREVSRTSKRKRVSAVLESGTFRGHLEGIVSQRFSRGAGDQREIRLNQFDDYSDDESISDPVPHAHGDRPDHSKYKGQMNDVVFINDLHDPARYATVFSEQEAVLRRKLAALYRIVEQYGWEDGIYSHITARTSPDSGEFLINPFGLMYGEITAGSLVKVGGDGAIINQGTTRLGINKAGYVLHSAIHVSRPDIQCIIHVHTAAGAAVSAMGVGLLPVSQEAMMVGQVSYHHYNGILVDEAEQQQIAADLGSKNMVMILHNHGLLAMGRTIEEALYYMVRLVKACETQVLALSNGTGMENIILPSRAAREQVTRVVAKGGGGVSAGSWCVGELEFEAHVRGLDRKGYRTGLDLKSSSLLNAGIQGNGDTSSPAQDSSHRNLYASEQRNRHWGDDDTRDLQQHAWEFLDSHGDTQQQDRPEQFEKADREAPGQNGFESERDVPVAATRTRRNGARKASTSISTQRTQSPMMVDCDVDSRRLDVSQSTDKALAALQQYIVPGSHPQPQATAESLAGLDGNVREDGRHKPMHSYQQSGHDHLPHGHEGTSVAGGYPMDEWNEGGATSEVQMLGGHRASGGGLGLVGPYSETVAQTTELAGHVAKSTNTLANSLLLN